MGEILKARFAEATVLHRTGALEQAEQIYRDLLREDPEYAGAWHRLGLVLHARREFPAAIEHIEKAISLSDANAVFWNNYGVVLKDSGRHQPAMKAFNKAVRLRDDYADAWANLGLVQAELGRLEEAEPSIRYALRLAPQHADALRNLALVYREKGEAAEGLRLCRDAIAAAPGKAEAWDLAGCILVALNRFEEAAAAHQRARTCNPTAVDVQLNLGFAYTDLDETEKARQSFRRAAEMRPDLPMWRLRPLSLCPAVFQSTEEIHAYRTELERQLDESLAEPPPFDWRTALRDGFMPSFALSHHGVCNRRLKEKFARLWETLFGGPRYLQPYGVAFWCANGVLISIGTAPLVPSIGSGPPHYGDVTLLPEFGGGTVSQAVLKRAADLASGNPMLPGETQTQYISRLIKMARNNEGKTAEEHAREFDKNWRRAHPPTIQATPPGPNGETPEERAKTLREGIEEEMENRRREEELWEFFQQMQRLPRR